MCSWVTGGAEVPRENQREQANYPYLVARQQSSALVFFQYTIADSVDEHIQTYWLTRNNIRNACLISCFFQLWISQLAVISHVDLVKTAFWSLSRELQWERKGKDLSPHKNIVPYSRRHLKSTRPQFSSASSSASLLSSHRRLMHNYHHIIHYDLISLVGSYRQGRP